MKTQRTFLTLTLCAFALITMGASCTADTQTDITNYAPSEREEEAQTKQMNEDVTVGTVVHTVTSAERLDTIPADRTTDQFKAIAKDTKAKDGFTYLFVTGKTKNISKETRTLDSNALKVRDGNKREYDFATDVTIYIPDDQTPTYLEIPAGETKEWKAYFLVPQTATQFDLKVTDLQLIPDAQAYIHLDTDAK